MALSFEAPPTSIGDGRSSVASFGLSPDETKIAYDTLGVAQEDIWIMNADGTGHRRLTNDRSIDRDPTWSPDGKEVGFYSDRDGETLNAWAIGADGGGLRRLTDRKRTANPGSGPRAAPAGGGEEGDFGELTLAHPR